VLPYGEIQLSRWTLRFHLWISFTITDLGCMSRLKNQGLHSPLLWLFSTVRRLEYGVAFIELIN
jgi:hypothetical protein